MRIKTLRERGGVVELLAHRPWSQPSFKKPLDSRPVHPDSGTMTSTTERPTAMIETAYYVRTADGTIAARATSYAAALRELDYL